MADNAHPEGIAKPGAPSRLELSRRRLLAVAAGLTGSFALGRVTSRASAQLAPGPQPPDIQVPDDPTKVQGRPLAEVGIRSPFVDLKRSPWQEDPTQFTAGWTFSPLQDLEGIITPSDLHFERHHSGTTIIDPAQHELLVHGMVGQPKIYTLYDLQRFPRESHIYFIECSGNSLDGYSGGTAESTAQSLHGLVSTSEWVGVPMRTIAEDVGLDPAAAWALFEGADAAVMTRSVPVEKLMDDALIAFIQNGEPIRPEQGFPMRLILPGWEGNMQIKWLRRIEFSDQPFYTKEETRHYTDRLPDGRSRQFTYVMEAKGLITWPSPGRNIPGPGQWQITGLAWSGRDPVERVEVSTDDGATWADAELSGPILPNASVRFRFPWEWSGEETVIMSRTTDASGYVQPTREQLLEVRGPDYTYHYNGIQSWHVHPDGSLTNGYVA